MAELLFKHPPDVALMGCEAGNFRVGGVRQEEVNAFFSDTGERAQVRNPAVQGQLVHFEVTRVQDGSRIRAQENGQSIRNGVVDGNELEIERTELFAVAFRHDFRLGPHAVLFELRFDKSQGQG